MIKPVGKTATNNANFYGGIAGRIGDSSEGIKILRCKNLCTGTVSATGQISQQRFLGGILGASSPLVSTTEGVYDLVIEDCVNLSSISYGSLSKNTTAGGIVGMMQCNYLIKNCRNGEEGSVYGKMSHDNSNVNAISAVAGIVGYMCYNSDTTIFSKGKIENCVNYGVMDFGGSTKGHFSGAAGIMGVAMKGCYVDITNCTNYGEIKHNMGTIASGVTPITAAGGIIGVNNTNSIVTDCTNYGNITETGSNVKERAGAGSIVGYQASVEGGLQTGAGCKVNCTVTAAHNGGMIVGNNVGTSTWGTVASPIYVKGTFGTTELNSSNYSQYLSGGEGSIECFTFYWSE